MPYVLVAGVDGVADRWIVALLADASRTVTWALCADAGAVLDATADCEAVAVDIPLGLPTDGHRHSERIARERLAEARSSIFFTPVRAVLACESYEDACAASRAATGKAISRQTWGLVRKIRDWDDAAPPQHVVEAHPELSFRAMAPELRFAGKKTARGALQRLSALGTWLPGPEMLTDVPDRVPLDDALDALACAWTARRYARGDAEVLGHETDPVTGRSMQIVI